MVRYKPSQFTKKELETMVSVLALDKGLDFLTGGKLNKYGRKAAIKIVKKTLPLALRAGGGVATVAGRSAIGAALPVVTNPYVLGGALGYGALQTEQGQQLLESASDSGRMARIQYEQALTDLQVGVKSKIRKTKSKFNKMVSAGMKGLKASPSYGKKGTINNAKKAFSVTTKAASAVTKGHKLPKSGIKRRLMIIMRKFR